MGHPVGDHGRPVGSASGMGGESVFLFRIDIPKGIHGHKGKVRIPPILKHILHAPVAEQIIVIPIMSRHADADLLAGTPPMADAVPCAQPLEPSQMIGVYVRGMAGHSLGQSQNVFPARSEKGQPEPHSRHQLRILPRVPPYVIPPYMAERIICMHDISIVIQPVPMPVLHLPLIELHRLVQLVFQPAQGLGFP